ncbi:unnamed protein product [Cuscuta europaea]|uniref:Uncharacterized protein n=2 Tax=Cuscuta subgen. Cuscuta TaxID=1824621 RepID=A0A9P0ZNY2_CUSEU|nr:unnamed protein product [Cuscuta epithymum]CAH9105657.1 unnamed protein product [Cuscuta europaea]CAH9119207.1 unnamed protein product [Cuscuta epithymum]
MITQAKLVEQLRDYQIRSQHKCPALTIFSPKPFLTTWADVAVAVVWALLFIVFVVSSYFALRSGHYWISLLILCLCVSLQVRLRILRQANARKRVRLLPLSM